MALLVRTLFIPADPARVWAFFSSPANLNELTPPAIRRTPTAHCSLLTAHHSPPTAPLPFPFCHPRPAGFASGNMPPAADTIVAPATPTGTSALAVVRASGPRVPELIRAIFGKLPEPRIVQRADYRDVAGATIDDVLHIYFAAPQTYTGEDVLEVSCHGNPLIVRKIVDDLAARGCRLADPGEFTKRAFLHGRLDLTQAEAVMDLIHARSERALAAASQQLHGALGRRLDELVTPLLQVLARVEAYIDFPEEDLPAEDRARLQADLATITQRTRQLRATDRYGDILRNGIRTVILGEPNAGKSSLLNRLLGRDRAIVSPEPGTTRDYLEESFALGPHALRLIDTAGLNGAPGPIERRGMEKTLEQADSAHLHLWVIDRSRPMPALPANLAARLTPANTIAVLNKSDLPVPSTPPTLDFPTVEVSALRGDGLDALHTAIVRHADQLCPEFTDEIVAVNARHAHALDEATAALTAANAKLELSASPELLASDLRAALDAFGRIAGKIDNERMLDALFATFCIGK